MTVYLGLRHTSPRGFLKRSFAELTKARLVTRYPHAGVVIGDRVYESNLADGVHVSLFDPDGWDLFPVDVSEDLIKQRFDVVKGSSYNALELLTFVGIKFFDSNTFYCYDLAYYLMTGSVAKKRVTPETLLALRKGGQDANSVAVVR